MKIIKFKSIDLPSEESKKKLKKLSENKKNSLEQMKKDFKDGKFDVTVNPSKKNKLKI